MVWKIKGPFKGHILFSQKNEFSVWYPEISVSHGGASYKIWLNSDQWFLRRSQLKKFFTFGPFLPPWGTPRGHGHFFSPKLRFPSLGDSSYQIWLKSDKVDFFANFSAPWWGRFSTNFFFIRKLCRPCLEDHIYEIWSQSDCWFMRRRFFKIYPILPLFTP